jgi:hypothetical protein
MAPRCGSFSPALAYSPGRRGAHLHLPALEVVGADPPGALGCADACREARGDRCAPYAAGVCAHSAIPVHLSAPGRDMAHQPSPLNQRLDDPAGITRRRCGTPGVLRRRRACIRRPGTRRRWPRWPGRSAPTAGCRPARGDAPPRPARARARLCGGRIDFDRRLPARGARRTVRTDRAGRSAPWSGRWDRSAPLAACRAWPPQPCAQG